LLEKAYVKFAGTPSTTAIGGGADFGGGADLLNTEGVLNVGSANFGIRRLPSNKIL